MKKVLDVGTLKLSKNHIQMATKALKSNRLSYGPMTAEFETKFSALHGNKYGVFTNSGTSALRASIHALKILNDWRDGDEIIMPATTFVATYNVILHNNMKPVLVDIGWDMNIDVELIEKAITKKTRAIMPVHLLGRPADMPQIMSLARAHKLKVIEDSCEAMMMKDIGNADVTCFSFYVAHLLVTGVGGMAITNDEKLAKLIRSLIFHGRDDKYLKIEDDDNLTGQKLKEMVDARFRFLYPGYSDRGTEVEAALGLVELETLKTKIAIRQANANYLGSRLYFGTSWFVNYLKNHAFMMFPYFNSKRDDLMLYMESKGITTRTLMPLINQPYIKAKKRDFPQSAWILKEGMLFGCHQALTRKDLDFIVKTIQDFEND